MKEASDGKSDKRDEAAPGGAVSHHNWDACSISLAASAADARVEK